MNSAADFRLERDAYGRLVLTTSTGEAHVGIVPVRAFPIGAPQEGTALVSPDGHELVWIERLDPLPSDIRSLIEDELRSREFMPEIQRIVTVSSFATPSTWQVVTDRGETRFILRGEEDIRRFGAHSLLIADSHGIQFLVRDIAALDRGSRRLLDRFL